VVEATLVCRMTPALGSRTDRVTAVAAADAVIFGNGAEKS
jgi:hypothetical protein